MCLRSTEPGCSHSYLAVTSLPRRACVAAGMQLQPSCRPLGLRRLCCNACIESAAATLRVLLSQDLHSRQSQDQELRCSGATRGGSDSSTLQLSLDH